MTYSLYLRKSSSCSTYFCLFRVFYASTNFTDFVIKLNIFSYLKFVEILCSYLAKISYIINTFYKILELANIFHNYVQLPFLFER